MGPETAQEPALAQHRPRTGRAGAGPPVVLPRGVPPSCPLGRGAPSSSAPCSRGAWPAAQYLPPHLPALLLKTCSETHLPGAAPRGPPCFLLPSPQPESHAHILPGSLLGPEPLGAPGFSHEGQESGPGWLGLDTCQVRVLGAGTGPRIHGTGRAGPVRGQARWRQLLRDPENPPPCSWGPPEGTKAHGALVPASRDRCAQRCLQRMGGRLGECRSLCWLQRQGNCRSGSWRSGCRVPACSLCTEIPALGPHGHRLPFSGKLNRSQRGGEASSRQGGQRQGLDMNPQSQATHLPSSCTQTRTSTSVSAAAVHLVPFSVSGPPVDFTIPETPLL